MGREKLVTSKLITDDATGDRYVSLTLENGARKMDPDVIEAYPSVHEDGLRSVLESAEIIPKLRFIPYYFRANRGGKGHMRVGLQRFEM